MGKWYVVVKGRKPGFYRSWDKCREQVYKYPGAIYKSFKDPNDAQDFYHNQTTSQSSIFNRPPTTIDPSPQYSRNTHKIPSLGKRKRIPKPVHDGIVEKKRKRTKDDFINIYTDGSCFGNGRKSARAGVGVFFGDDVNYNDKRNVSKKLLGKQTNNRAELTALIEAINIVKDQYRKVNIYSDSEYSIKGITGVNKIRKNQDLFEKIFDLLEESKCSIEFHKVPAHTGIVDPNSKADELAKKGAYKN